MSDTYVNAAPQTELLGISDKSTRRVPITPEALPQHLPIVYLYTQKGKTEPQIVVGSNRDTIYGADSFDLRMPWATHATALSNVLSEAANSHFIQRVEPSDSKTSTLRLYVDVLKTNVPNYERNADGTYARDSSGNPKVGTPATVAGYKVKFVAVAIELFEDESNGFGQGQIIDGDQADEATGETSKRYPLFDFMASSFGAWGDLQGVRMYAPTLQSNNPVDTRLIRNQKVYPFRISLLEKSDSLSTATLVNTQSGSPSITVALKPGLIDKNTGDPLYIGTEFLKSYQDLKNLPKDYGPLDGFKIYDSNITTVLNMFVAAELPFVDMNSDLEAGVTDQQYRFNLFGGVNSSGAPYYSYVIDVESADDYRLTESTTMYLKGGADGTMDEEKFAELVNVQLARWADKNDPLQNTARYPISDFYDTGFPLATKYLMNNIISLRKNTAIAVSPYDVLGTALDIDQESNLGSVIVSRMRNYPESEYFGTPTVRGVFIGRHGHMIDTTYPKDLPYTIEYAYKKAKYMGAGNGVWKNDAKFDFGDGAKIELFDTINVTDVPQSVRNKDWDNGMNWVEYFDRSRMYFPALQTVYNNDTSVLKSTIVVAACQYIELIGEMARRQYSGAQTLTNLQLKDAVEKFVNDNLEGKFDNVVTVVPEVYFTDADIARGFSWKLRIKVYGPNMKTIQTMYIEAYRLEDLPQ